MDVRSAPYSRYTPPFNRNPLGHLLDNAGIGYTYLGDQLGGRPDDRSCYDANGRLRYDRVAETDLFLDALRLVIRAADQHRIALLCAEKAPLECHRTLLIARALNERGLAVAHILVDGSLEDHDTAIVRLVDLNHLPPGGDMFCSRADVIAEALDRRARKFAYVDTNRPPRRNKG